MFCIFFCCYIVMLYFLCIFFFFSSRRRHTRWTGDWSSDVCSSDLAAGPCRGLLEGPGSEPRHDGQADGARSEERRVGKSVDLGGRRIIKKKKKKEDNKRSN